MPLHIARNDIANMRTQAIVCPSNSELRIGGGAGGRVASIAGIEKVQEACDSIGGCPTGHAVATPAFEFPADILVHAVGPVWAGGESGEIEALRSCVQEALSVAYENDAETIAMPLMSSGSFGFPPDIAIEVETSAIEKFLEAHEMEVWLVLFDNDSIRAGRSIFDDIEEYIDDVYVREERICGTVAMAPMPQASYGMPQAAASQASERKPPRGLFKRRREKKVREDEVRERAETGESYAEASAPCDFGAMLADAPMQSLAERLGMLDESFAQTVLRLIDERGMTDVEVYKRANISKQLFAKIRKDDNYRPTKKTACALAFALKLDYDDATALLRRAGFALSHSSKFDIIVEYFLIKGNHDIFQVNEALFAFDQQLLG